MLNTALALDRQLGVFTWIAMITQGRRGEAAGIHWHAIDLETGELRVEGSLESGRRWKPYPKNRKGRALRLDPLTLALLWEERQLQAELAGRFDTKLVDDAWLFADPLSPDGSKPMDPDLLSKRLHKLCDRLGVRMYRNLYGLRHDGATSLVKAGVDIRTVAGRLGNDPAVTLRRYAPSAPTPTWPPSPAWPNGWPTSWPTSSSAPVASRWRRVRIDIRGLRTTPPATPPPAPRMCRECARARQRRPVRVISSEELKRSG